MPTTRLVAVCWAGRVCGAPRIGGGSAIGAGGWVGEDGKCRRTRRSSGSTGGRSCRRKLAPGGDAGSVRQRRSALRVSAVPQCGTGALAIAACRSPAPNWQGELRRREVGAGTAGCQPAEIRARRRGPVGRTTTGLVVRRRAPWHLPRTLSSRAAQRYCCQNGAVEPVVMCRAGGKKRYCGTRWSNR